MKQIVKQMLGLLIGGILLISCNNQNQKSVKEENKSGLFEVYDSIKAAEYGADEYGMKKYVMAFLKRGPNREMDEVKSNEIQMAHLSNINRMAEQGKLILAGPFFDNGDLRGIYIFNVKSIAEAEELTNTDPAIIAGVLVMELKEWYGSAALMSINELHKTLEKKNIIE